jgi:hypothetical protein
MNSPHPQYSVYWIKKETCKACGHESTLQQTYGFFKAEDALKHAVDVLNEGCTLLYIEL